MPSKTELLAYAKKLPDIYRDILAAFPEIEPYRKAGFGLAFQTLAAHFVNTRRGHGLGEIQEACKRLKAAGIMQIKNRIFAHPTALGEQLIAVVTGRPVASNAQVPVLPTRTW